MTDESTGKTEHFKGQLFGEIVFNDSVREFMNKRRTLSNYFDKFLDKDIFDYIPPLKTNQIFTSNESSKRWLTKWKRKPLAVLIIQTIHSLIYI